MSEDLLQGTAQLIVDYGLKDLGYEYVILDDCWSKGRDASANNSLIADTSKFPQGMAAVADHVHGLGLKFGMYSSAGQFTCGKYAGSLGYEEIDAQTWASWGVDYIKCEFLKPEVRVDLHVLMTSNLQMTTATTPARLGHRSCPSTATT